VADVSLGERPPTRRLEIWEASWELFKQNPVAGVGFGGYWVGVSRHYAAGGDFLPYQAHNDYLEVLASGGVVGAALFAWLVTAATRRARAQLKAGGPFRRAACFGALTGLAGVAVHSAVEFGLHNLPVSVLFVALAVIAAADVSAREARSTHASRAGGGRRSGLNNTSFASEVE
jgi:O-antigen ligase